LLGALFFLLFGYLIQTSEIANLDTLVWSVGIVLYAFLLRIIQLKISKIPLFPFAIRGTKRAYNHLVIPVDCARAQDIVNQ
jgi:hypothetical protein